MSPQRPDWVVVALAATAGVVVGLVAAVGLGSTRGETRTTTTTVTVAAKPPAGATLIAKTAVPSVVGERLDVAKDRVRRAGFVTRVEGGGALGVLRDRNWEVTSQDPVGGQVEQTGSTVRLRIERP